MLSLQLLRRCAVLASYLPLFQVAAQESFSQTVGWREPSISVSYNDRLSLAETTLSIMARQINYDDASTIQSPSSALLLYTLAEYDRRSNSSVFKANVTSALGALATSVNYNFTYMQVFRYNSDRLRLGLAYFSAHIAYLDSPQESDLLKAALALWDASAAYYVSQDAATAGTLPGIPNFNSTCVPPGGTTPVSVAGALSWDKTASINGETIGPWIALSSSLYTSHLNATFLELAALSIQFAKTFLSNGTMVWDTYTFSSCTPSSPTETWTYNGGYFLQGLSTFYAANMSAATTEDLAYLNELAASLILSSRWTNSSTGINREDAITSSTTDVSQRNFGADWKAILVNGLYGCMSAGLLNDTVANLTRQYIAVQYNAVRELANFTAPSLDQQVYGPSWIGTPTPLQDYDSAGQLAAAELFTTALGVGPQDVANTTNPSQPTTTSPSLPQVSRSKTGIIVGSVVGGAAALIGFVVAIIYLSRRKRAITTPLPDEDSQRPTMSTEPYFATSQQYPVTERGVLFARHDGGSGYLMKREHTPYSLPSASGNTSGSSVHPDSQASAPESVEHVRVDASALQRLLLSIGGALSDLQRRESRHASTGELSELPPDYEEGPVRR
ncbi:unnamed protein product [Peniophora sp. CBMAI 1063]|nr:unnamed protein product [Peniophora sp. CBMAI 1063]